MIKKIILGLAVLFSGVVALANEPVEILSSTTMVIQPKPVSFNIQVERTVSGVVLRVYIPTENMIENVLAQ